MVTFCNCSLDWYIDEPIVYRRGYALGLSCHGGMDSMGAESSTVDGIVAVCRGASDNIGWVNILNGHWNGAALEVFLDLFLKEDSDILILYVSSCVHFSCRRNQICAGAFSHQDYSVASIQNSLFKMVQKTVVAIKVEGIFRNKTEVYVTLGQGSMGCNEARLPSHHLDQADSVVCALRLHMGSSYGRNSRSYSCVEAKGGVDEGKVVVDSLRYAYYSYLQTSSLHFLSNIVGTAKSAVATDCNEDIDVLSFKGVYNLLHFLSATSG